MLWPSEQDWRDEWWPGHSAGRWPAQLSSFPRLQEVTIFQERGVPNTEEHQDAGAYRIACSMPAVHTLCASAIVALHLYTPMATCACFVLVGMEDLDHVEELLSPRSEIETLTLVVLLSRAMRSLPSASHQTMVARRLLGLLTPRSDGTSLVPRLRQLGIRWQPYHPGFEPFEVESMEETRVPSPLNQANYFRDNPPTLTATDVLALERNRWRVSRGLDPIDLASGLPLIPQHRRGRMRQPSERHSETLSSDRCVPLESIKLCGIHIDATAWATLTQMPEATAWARLTQIPETKFSCFPHPAPGEHEEEFGVAL